MKIVHKLLYLYTNTCIVKMQLQLALCYTLWLLLYFSLFSFYTYITVYMNGETGDVPTIIKKIKIIRKRITGTIQYAFLLHKNLNISTIKFFLFILPLLLFFVLVLVLLHIQVKCSIVCLNVFLLFQNLFEHTCILQDS